MDKVLLFSLSLILGSIGACIIKNFAFKWGFVDNPKERSSHERPTPKGGAIGILTAFIFSSVILDLPPTFWSPAVILALVSLWGDKYDLSPKIRLPFQLAAALIFIQLLAVSHQPSAFLLFILVVFIVATANWYNFMDGINGIAGITGIIGFSLLAAFNVLSGSDNSLSILSLCIAFSCIGFLPFNIPKAKVFMGDIGSILLGFVFAEIVVMLSKSFFDFVCIAGFLFPFYADEFITMAIRIKDGENLLRPHRRHFYQILANEMGIAHWKISAGYGILQLIVGLSILAVIPFGVLPIIILLLIYFIGFVWANYLVRVRIARKA